MQGDGDSPPVRVGDLVSLGYLNMCQEGLQFDAYLPALLHPFLPPTPSTTFSSNFAPFLVSFT